jgi:hypothetical protein
MTSRAFFRGLVHSLLLLCAALLVACGAPGPQFSALAPLAPEQGDIYLYRTSVLFAMAQPFSVSLDGAVAGSLYNASYLHFRLPPGKHALLVVPGPLTKTSTLDIDVVAGQAAFFQYDFASSALGNLFFVGSAIEPRDRERALHDLRELKAAK